MRPKTGGLRLHTILSQQTRRSSCLEKKALARHSRCGVYCGARETVGGSSVSSGCWGEDSNHEYGWARRTPTYVAPIRYLDRLKLVAPKCAGLNSPLTRKLDEAKSMSAAGSELISLG